MQRMFFSSTTFFIFLISCVGGLVYSNSFKNPFIWDDQILVVNNIFLKSPAKISQTFTQDIGKGGNVEYHFYRPLQIFTYQLDYWFWKLNVKGYHLTNTILHIGTALAMYWLLNIIFEIRALSFFTVFLFIVHPIHTEAVTYIAGRADPLVGCFMLLSIILCLKTTSFSNLFHYCGIGVTYALALLAKEYALITPLLIFICYYAKREKARKIIFIPIVIVTLFYIFLRLVLLKHIAYPEGVITSTFFERMPGFFAAVTNYIRLLLLPFNLHMEYGLKLFKFLDLKVIVGIGLLLILWYICWKQKNRLISFSIFWFFIGLLPQSNFYPINAYMAEHWVYLPSLGFFLIIGNAIYQLYSHRNTKTLSIIIFLFLISFYSLFTIKQNTIWAEPIAFYKRTLGFAPLSHRVYLNLGLSYKEKGLNEDALKAFRRTLELNPKALDAYNNIGLICWEKGELQKTLNIYNKILEIDPKYKTVYGNLANLYVDLKDAIKARDYYQKAIELDPYNPIIFNNYGMFMYTSAKDRNSAIELFKKALELDPDFADVHNNIAVAYYYVKKPELAIKHYHQAIKLGYIPNPLFTKLIEDAVKPAPR